MATLDKISDIDYDYAIKNYLRQLINFSLAGGEN
jgi:hypothetical protein